MNGEFNYAGNWLLAAGVSLVFHIVLATALLCFNSTPEKKPGVAEPAKSVASEANALAETVSPAPSPEANEPSKAAEPPKVKESPDVPKERSFETKPPKRETQTAEEPAPVPAASAESEIETYVVRSGDTLSKIAKRCSCTLDELAKLNGKSIKALSRLQVGQKIRVKRSQD